MVFILVVGFVLFQHLFYFYFYLFAGQRML